MMNRSALFSLFGLLLLSGLSASFSPRFARSSLLQLSTQKKECRSTATTLFVQSQEEQDWFTEMESKSYESLKKNKEPLFNHDDWVEYRSPDRRLNDIFDYTAPAMFAFVLWLLWTAIQM